MLAALPPLVACGKISGGRLGSIGRIDVAAIKDKWVDAIEVKDSDISDTAIVETDYCGLSTSTRLLYSRRHSKL